MDRERGIEQEKVIGVSAGKKDVIKLLEKNL